MENTGPVISIAILLAAALVGGMVAHRLKQPVILGYLVVGVAVGPHALGLVDDLVLVEAAATIGVALLMFTLGLEVSTSQLKQIGKVGVWGGAAQIVFTFALGMLAGFAIFGWPLTQSALFGLLISLSSTAVCLKLLLERGELDSAQGRIMIGILIMQDVSVVLMMVGIPLINGSIDALLPAIGIAIGKAVLFVGLAIALGAWVLPWLMGRVGGIRSRELFLLTVLVLSLGAALGTQIFGLSAVFGAFLIGLVLRESRFAFQAMAEITPLRDIFATLFFVSLGMLLDPRFLLDNWQIVLATVAVIAVLKFAVVYGVVRFFGFSNRIGVITGAGLFQIGEFAFILAQAGLVAGIATAEFYSLILASAIVTMLITPFSMSFVASAYLKRSAKTKIESPVLNQPIISQSDSGKVILAGYGRTGQNVAKGLDEAGIPYIIIDIDPERVTEARKVSKPRIYGDASNPHVLEHAGIGRAKMFVVTMPDTLAVVTAVREALQINPQLKVIARVHFAREAEMLRSMGVTELINPEYEASLQFLKRVLEITGSAEAEVKEIVAAGEQKGELVQFDKT